MTLRADSYPAVQPTIIQVYFGMRMSSLFVSAAIAACAVIAAPLVAQDRDAEDHPLVPRYPSAVIAGYRAPSLDEIAMPTGPIANEQADTNIRRLEGRVTHVGYDVVPSTAPLQIQRYYADLLKKDGFDTVFSCAGSACGKDMGALIMNSGRIAPPGFDAFFNDRVRVLVARRAASWVLLYISDAEPKSAIYQAVVEEAVPADPAQ